MRISHRYKFVFLATPRTGSTSVRSLLDEYSDIKSVHKTETTEQFPFFHHISAAELKAIFDDRGWDWSSYRRFCVVRNPFDRVVSLFHHHQKITARHLERARPAERLLRKARELIRPTQRFPDYIRTIDPARRLATSLPHFLGDESGHFLVDDVLRFEELDRCLPDYLRNLGITDLGLTDAVPHLNSSQARVDYREYYDSFSREHVAGLYAYEIERFGYRF